MSIARVHSQIEEWRKRLLDLSKRNRLINCKIGARAAIEVIYPEPEGVWQRIVVNNGPMSFAWKRDLLDEEDEDDSGQLSLFYEGGEDINAKRHNGAGETADESARSGPKRSEMEDCLASPFLREEHVLTQMADRTLGTRLNRLSLNAKTAISEQGINILYLAYGLLRWYESANSDVPLFSPLLLVPVQLDRAGPDAPWKISLYEEDVLPNHCLRELLHSNYRLELPDLPESGLENAGDRGAFLKSVSDTVRAPMAHSRWEVMDRVILGTFSFQKLAMWQDLGNNRDRIAAHDLCRAIAGDDTAAVSAAAELPSPEDFDDRVHPKDVHTILDSDSSQLEAILAVKSGMSAVVDGPPGTGKSQTIANIIAESLASGKTVLFVSEKAAALEVVKRRLDACNLGDFCLECHSHKANKKDVITELGRCLSLPSEGYRDQSEELARLQSVRQRLNTYVRALHRPRGAMKTSAYAVHGRLARLQICRVSRCPISNVLNVDAATLRERVEGIGRLTASRAVIEEHDRHPWRGCNITSFSLTLQDDIKHDFESLSKAILDCVESLATMSQYGFTSMQPGKSELETALHQAKGLLEFPELPAQWFARNPRQIALRLVELHSVSSRCQELLTGVSVFRSEIVCEDFKNLVTELCDHSSPLLKCLRVAPPRTVKTQQAWLAALADELAGIRELIEEIAVTVGDFSHALRVPIDKDASLRLLTKLTAVGGVLKQTGLLKPSWFDDQKRAQLQQVATNCQKQVDEAKRLRNTLSLRMNAMAFDTDGEPIAIAASRFEPFWSRFWCRITGEWGRFVRACSAVYLQSPTKSPRDLLNDLSQLRVYHSLIRSVRNEENANAADLICDDRGRARWQDLISGIEAIARLRAIIKISDRLKQVLTTEGLLDRGILDRATEDLGTRLIDLDHRASALGQRLALVGIGPNKTSYTDASPTIFKDWLQQMESSVRQRIAKLEAVANTLNTDQDVALFDLPIYLARFEEIRRLQARQNDLRSDLGGTVDLPPQFDPGSLAPLIETTHHVAHFLDTYGDSPRASLVDVVTRSDSRRTVTNACTRLASLFHGPLEQSWGTLWKCFPPDQPASARGIHGMPLVQLGEWLHEQAKVAERLQEWIRFRETEQALHQLNVLPVFHEVLNCEIACENAPDAYVARFCRVWLDAAYSGDVSLREFHVEEHENLISVFRDLDRAAIGGAFKRIRTKLLADPNRPHSGMLTAPPSSELGILMKEVAKKKRHMALRQLFRRIPTLLPRLKPCLMMSPLAVSTYLDSSDLTFDLVIFDEASQVRPFDAIGAVYRGTQIVVAGDQKQLPPTSFFDRLVSDEDSETSDEEEESLGRLSDFESVLDVCCSMGMPRKRLRWHYRSRREPLIAFSNRHFYGNELATFPSVFDADSKTAVQFHSVPNGRWRPGSEGGDNPAEARETALLAFQLLEQNPDQSLGVITFNQRQQFAVLDELERLRRDRPETEEFFQDDRNEPFFVQNLENVQGDERDRIIISVGYGYLWSCQHAGPRFLGPVCRRASQGTGRCSFSHSAMAA